MTVTSTASQYPDHRENFRSSTFRDVFRSEWTKLRSVRSTFWALAVAVVLAVGLGAAISAGAAHAYSTSSASAKLTWDPTAVSLSGLAIAQLAIAVLGVLYITSEYSTGMIRTSLTVVPKRGHMLLAKTLNYAFVTLAIGEIISFVAFFVGQALLKDHAPNVSLGDPGVARAVLGAGLYLTALAILGVAAGTLLRHTAAAISAVVAVLFVLPVIVQALPASLRHPVSEFWPTLAGSQITNVYHSAHTLDPWSGLGVMCVFVAVVYVIAWIRLDRRDA